MLLDSSVAAVVTGAASGLGEATARLLASRGVKVALFDLNEERGQSIAREIGGIFAAVNVTSDESVHAGFAKARAAHGQERILVNCAGIASAVKTAFRDKTTGEFRHHPIADFERILQINLVGSFRCAAISAAGMLGLPNQPGGDRGVIVNTSSVAAEDGQIGQTAYSASKAGLVGLTLPMARDLMNDNIRVNTIMPGIFNTSLMAAYPESIRSALSASVPYPKRLGEPSEYAQLVVAIIEIGYFNGEHIRLDGAIRMAPR
jgi:NAD(P)-dependent dehydrogenase (short-subunit alcohol dehydrogenase family)